MSEDLNLQEEVSVESEPVLTEDNNQNPELTELPIQPIHSGFELKAFVIHQIRKDRNTVSESHLAKNELSLTKANINFTHKINGVYYKKRPIFGHFQAQTGTSTFQSLLKKYICDRSLNFIDFSKAATNLLVEKMDKTSATGGFVLFLHYIYRGEEIVGVMMVQNSIAYGISDEELDVNISKIVNLDKLEIAAFINITKWKISLTTTSNEDYYLSFLKGLKKVSNYFSEFIGSTDNLIPRIASENLINGINTYCQSNNINDKEKKEIKKRVYKYIDGLKRGETAQLSSISALVDINEVDKFAIFASSESIQIGSEFSPDRKVLNKLMYVYVVQGEIKVEFPQSLLETKDVVYNKDKKTLTIKNIEDVFLQQLE